MEEMVVDLHKICIKFVIEDFLGFIEIDCGLETVDLRQWICSGGTTGNDTFGD